MSKLIAGGVSVLMGAVLIALESARWEPQKLIFALGVVLLAGGIVAVVDNRPRTPAAPLPPPVDLHHLDVADAPELDELDRIEWAW